MITDTAQINHTTCYQQPFVSLYNEDLFETMKRLPDGCVDLILTDPPYGSTNLEWDKRQDYIKLFSEWFRIGKENAPILVFGQQPHAIDIIIACRSFFRYEIIWQKSQMLGFLNANKMPMREHENIFIFYKKLPTYNPQKVKAENLKVSRKKIHKQSGVYASHTKQTDWKETGFRYPGSVVKYSNWNGGGFTKKPTIHPTQKPLDLIRNLILTYSNKGETIFDGYSGSGTTAEACIIEGRKFIGSELNKEYFDKSVLRLKNVPTQLF